MSEAQTAYGTPVHKYKVGDTFDFDGIVEILKVNGYAPAKRECTYQVKMADGRIVDVEESWIDGGIDHFDLDEHGRAKENEYAVSYIASAPEELKVGDRVKTPDGTKVRIVKVDDNGTVWVENEDGSGEGFFKKDHLCALRKLPDTSNPMDVQVGGNHYKKCKIEPAEYIHANGLDFFQGNIVKYITRFRDKDGKKDLEKIKHYCDMLIQLEYPE